MPGGVDHEIARALRKQGRWAVSERQVHRVRKAGLLPPFSQGPGRGRGRGRSAPVSAGHIDAAAAALDAVRRTRSLDLAALDLYGQGRSVRPARVSQGVIVATSRIKAAIAPAVHRLGAHFEAQKWERPDLPASDDEHDAAMFDVAELLGLAAADALAETKWGKQGLRRLASTSKRESPEALFQSAVTNLTLMGIAPTTITRDGLIDAGHLLGEESPETEVPRSWSGFPPIKPSETTGVAVMLKFSVGETSRIIAEASAIESAAAREAAATVIRIPDAIRETEDPACLTYAALSWPPLRRPSGARWANATKGYIAVVMLIHADATNQRIEADTFDALLDLIHQRPLVHEAPPSR